MNQNMRNILIAVAAGGGLFIVLTLLNASVAGLNIGPQIAVLPLVLGSGVFASLNAMKGNRKLKAVPADVRAQALAFPARPGEGYIVLMRRARSVKHLGFDVMLDAVSVTQLMPKQFTVLPVSAGRHSLFADIAAAPGKSALKPQDVLVPEGGLMIFETRTVMGMTQSTVHLDPVADSPALRAELEKLGLVLPVAAPASGTSQRLSA